MNGTKHIIDHVIIIAALILLTDRKASTELCSIIRHPGSG